MYLYTSNLSKDTTRCGIRRYGAFEIRRFLIGDLDKDFLLVFISLAGSDDYSYFVSSYAKRLSTLAVC